MMDLLAALEASALSRLVVETDSIWSYPTILTLHTLGLGLLVGGSWALALRLLGIGRTIPLGPLRALFPMMWLGFWINAVTGSMLFVADATTRGTSALFMAKLSFVAIGVMTIVFIRRKVYGTGTEPPVVSGTARVLAVTSLLAWLAAITAGRLLAYV